ncbi:flavodoxin [Filifactor alocis ATCC 35896]|uniref:Flavodoxin n=1 Tax=Filifactor alocis (strain ATCC 35896 / CCUG 47790 / D40 B5) TaxID=546269 RepID=D6GSJ1_FILAD|nr:flavodoxin [Filifactor alocis]EFE28632.1 flavodoxin [Filifactor alocis ATCC 35896]
MAKISLVYWSGTGNTQAMADYVVEGVKSAGAEVDVFEVTEANADDVLKSDVILLGCPSMGSEVLEEESMEPFMEEIEGGLSGKKVGLFGSYGWGDGQWMRDWQERVEGAGASMICDGIIVNGEPSDDSVIDELKSMGSNAALA